MGLPERKQAGPRPTLGLELWSPVPEEGARLEPRNVGDRVPTPWEERLSSPRPQTAGWRIAKKDQGCWAPSCGPKGPNLCPAVPHLTSLGRAWES